MDKRFVEEQRGLAQRIGVIVQRYASGADKVVPNLQRTRTEIKNVVWSQILKPYYIGNGDDPFNGAEPRSQYARLLYEGIQGSTQISVEQQAAIVQKVTRDDDLVYRWLTGPRSQTPILEIGRGEYDPFHLFVDQKGYRLSDRVWNSAIDVRTRIDRLLDYHIAQGTAAVDIADLLEDFLTPGAGKIKTNSPYGIEGNYAARRLARTEITAAAGRSTVNASKVNPFVDEIKWTRSNNASKLEKKCEVCADNANGGKDKDGVYQIDKVPQYPAHPHEMCTLSPVVNQSSDELVAELRRDIQARNKRSNEIKGMFSVEWLTNTLMTRGLSEVLALAGVG